MKITTKLVFILVLGYVLASCNRRGEFSEIPAIEFKSLAEINGSDTLQITIDFVDGDGDIGLNDEDTFPPYNIGSRYYNNIFLELMCDSSGVWITKDLIRPLYYRIPYIDNNGPNNSLKGEISVVIEENPFGPDIPIPYDTVKYSIQIVDRALNESNVVETGLYIRTER